MRMLSKNKKITCLVLAIIMALGQGISANAELYGQLDTSKSKNLDVLTYNDQILSNEENKDDVDNLRYSQVSSKYGEKVYSGEPIVFQVADSAIDEVKVETVDSREVVKIARNESLKFKIEVPKTAIYNLKFKYQSINDDILPIQFSMKIDGKVPFVEALNVKLESLWKRNSEKTYDRYGKELVTIPEKVFDWNSKYLMDSSYRYGETLDLELSRGVHEIELEIIEGEFYLDEISLLAPKELEVRNDYEKAEGNSLIIIEAEDFTFSNDSSVHAISEYDTNVSPIIESKSILNVLDSTAFNTAGQKVIYEFNVEKAGNYKLALNYRQSEKDDFPVFLDVEIDGEVLSTDFQNYPLKYSSKFSRTTLNNGSQDLTVNLSKGKHSIALIIKNDVIRAAIENIENTMRQVNDLELEITKVVGTNSDKYRDLKIERFIPGVESSLKTYAENLKKSEESLLKYSGSDKTVSVLSSTIIAAEQLLDLADNIDELTFRRGELSSNQNSVNSNLANALDKMLGNDLGLDNIYLYQDDAKLPASVNFFQALWAKTLRFFSSFTDKSYSASGGNKENLQVWVNRSNQHVQIMQKMIDDSFTPKTGIKVDISIMPDQYKLVLANSAGNTPDVVTGINYTVPYELAIRGALLDLTQFEDFQETASVYGDGFFLTSTINDSIYALPETMNFWVQMYRTDIMEKLDLEIPKTMQDVVDMLPDLQMRGLNYFYPTAGMAALRNFHGTTPYIIQYGGSLYKESAAEGTALGYEASVAGFTALTELFTLYGMPVNVENFYQRFRNGDLPIGISDYGTYNLITNAAPELANSWKIAAAPGHELNGKFINAMCGNAESSAIFKKDDAEREAKAWEFMKWWSSTDVQSEYGQMLQLLYGAEYLWNSANLEAFSNLPWPSNDKEVIISAAKNVVDVARVPGTYLMEREMSNAFNDITVEGMTAQSRIDQAVKVINREFERKLEEFGFIDSDGNVIKKYEVPTIERVRKLLGRD